MLFQTSIPLLTSDVTLGLGEFVRDRNTLLRHSKALMCTALRADVVGGCIDGAARGGNDRAVGWIRARRGTTRVVTKAGLDVVASSVVFISTSILSSEASPRSSKTN